MKSKIKHFLLFFSIGLSLDAFAANKDDLCKKLSESHVQTTKKIFNKDYTLQEVDSFYSSKFDACIHTEFNLIGPPNFQIRDTSHSLLRDEGYAGMLLHCDEDGADSVVIEKLKSFKGKVSNVPYKLWLDDGEGGLPRTLKTPQVPYSRQKCDELFKRWVARLKSQQ